MLGVPGEALPELAIGGMMAPKSTHQEGISSTQLTRTLRGSISLHKAPTGKICSQRTIDGSSGSPMTRLATSYLPTTSFYTTLAYLAEAEGDHYEETNSLGPETAERITGQLEKVAKWLND